jgi:DNA repair protein RecN (Recombination protein N)
MSGGFYFKLQRYMLQKLSIKNYAIIDEVEISFSPKLNIITGETGAGKSIIAGALGLILGERADSATLIDKEKKCVVEGIFAAGRKKAVIDFLQQNDLDIQPELLIRREITANGKSRAFVNDSPVTLSQLAGLSNLLVDLHQQFDTLQLSENDFQRQVLDALAGNADLLNEYQQLYRNWKAAEREYGDLTLQKQQFDKEAGYNRFQYDELAAADLREHELEEVDAELKLLNNAEGIKNILTKAYNDLREGENPLVQQLKTLVNQLQHYASLHPGLPLLIERMQSAHTELQDVAGEIEQISNRVNYDPKKIELLDIRLSLGYRLMKKHGVKTTGELLQIYKLLEEKLQAALDIDEAILKKKKQAEQLLTETKQLAEKISKARKKHIKLLEDKVNRLLVQVGMPNAKLHAATQDLASLNENGCDEIEFLFNANLPAGTAEKDGQFLPIRKVASGGELSRLMLCIKSLVAQTIDLPTLIFDEIDTGISGEAARQVGIIMKELAAKRQVISITHQPQIAGKADAHFFVFKEIVRDKIKTNIRLLTEDERITAIAIMLGGEKPTAAAMENAKEMVSN